MTIISIPVTGQDLVYDVTTPQGALAEFYRAFNGGDIELMRQNWLNGQEVSMSNPLGGLRRGWPDIKTVYARLFDGPAQVYVEFYDYSIHQHGDMFGAVGRERGYFRIGEREIQLAIRTSRVYRRHDGRWRQIHHHGSIDNPELLEAYQQAVMGEKQ
jgi:hypothetical protein